MLKAHQQKIVALDPKKCGMFLGCGGGKTAISLSLAKGKTLVVCPKTLFLDKNWQREVERMGISVDLTVLSKEQFKKQYQDLPRYDTLIIDEAHYHAGVLTDIRRRKGVVTPKSSQLFEATQWYIKNKEPERLYLVTATPTRNPMAVWALAKLLGRGNDFYTFRDTFYYPITIGGYQRWIQKKDKASKEKLGELVRKIGFTGRLDDWYDIPVQYERKTHCRLNSAQLKAIKQVEQEEPEPLLRFNKIHQIENGFLYDEDETIYFKDEKVNKVIDLAYEFDRLVVFAKYKGQIENIKKHLDKLDVPNIVLTGETKDRKEVLEEANSRDRNVIIIQSTISAGFELPQYDCMCFASPSFSFVDFEQAKGRIQRMNNIKSNVYVYLESGRIDKSVWSALENKSDFHEHIFLEKEL